MNRNRQASEELSKLIREMSKEIGLDSSTRKAETPPISREDVESLSSLRREFDRRSAVPEQLTSFRVL